jgi:hydroxyacylglutathione hydrolase
VFVGDVLFALGCGRLFEGTPFQLWQTLEALKAFPDDTLIFCGHEYTCRNADFVLSLDPNNDAVRERAQQVERAVQEGRVCVPFPLGVEKTMNPFLRAQDISAQKALLPYGELGEKDRSVEVLAELRRRRDGF